MIETYASHNNIIVALLFRSTINNIMYKYTRYGNIIDVNIDLRRELKNYKYIIVNYHD